ncbi:MAG TPA: CGNR zinc finger domain-containing protein [Kribbella sp.]|nr:CGNR zinc finger domain-containing protein [Kribbella sp.]
MPITQDPRPLVGEPLSLDLLNTVWIDGGRRHDLLDDVDGLRIWLAGTGRRDLPEASEAARQSLVGAREVLRGWLTGQGSADALNAILARGRLVRRLDVDGPTMTAETAEPADLAAWLALNDYLGLLERDPSRIRRCAHPDCVLHFYDISPKGNRRWCSMAGCGNRAKAARHYARTKEQ